MLIRRSRLSFAWVGCAIVAFGLLSGDPPVRGQGRPRNVILPPEGSNALREQNKNRELAGRLKLLREGAESASKDKAEDMKAIDHLAQWYAYRLTWPEIQNPPDGRGENSSRILDDFKREIDQFNRYKPQNQAFVDLFHKQAVVRLKDVLQNDRPIATVNGARMLGSLIQQGSEDAADACADALKDKGLNDGAKYWALEGLKAQLARWFDPPADAPVPKNRKEKEFVYVQAILETLDRKPPFDLRLVPVKEDRDGLREGLRAFRREAVRTLGNVRIDRTAVGGAPGLVDEKGTLALRPAQALLRVVNNDGLTPSVRLDEQVDAAIGVAQMRSRLLESYQPDYAAQVLGYFVVEFGSRTADKGTSTDPRVTGFPWKYQAARLGDALEAMRADAKGVKDPKAAAYVAQAVVQCLRVLKDIEVRGQGSAGDLKLWLDSNAPPGSTLYRGVDDSTVKPLSRSDDEEAADKPQPDKPKKPAPPKKPGDDKPKGPPKKP